VQPLFFPAGELVSEKLTADDVTHLYTLYLPKVCNLPLGMHWSVDIGLEDFVYSIQGVIGSAGNILQHMLTGIDEKLHPWFEAAIVKYFSRLFCDSELSSPPFL
jgi:hypothetical protein